MKSGCRRLNISIIGAGKVGTTLARTLFRAGHRIVGVVSLHKRSAITCGRLVKCRNCSDDVSIIPSATNVVLIAVPDSAIRGVADTLAVVHDLPFERMFVCHTSGALTSDELKPLGQRGAHTFSFHPIQTFPKEESLSDQIASMAGVTYGVEGSKYGLGMARRLVRHLGGNLLVVPKDAKIVYHLACVFASNYSVTLLGALESVAKLLKQKRTTPFEKLLHTSLENALKFGAAKALTGPIVRGDVDVIAKHIAAIRDPKLRSLYRSLGAYALGIARKEHRLTREKNARLKSLLEKKG